VQTGQIAALRAHGTRVAPDQEGLSSPPIPLSALVAHHRPSTVDSDLSWSVFWSRRCGVGRVPLHTKFDGQAGLADRLTVVETCRCELDMPNAAASPEFIERPDWLGRLGRLVHQFTRCRDDEGARQHFAVAVGGRAVRAGPEARLRCRRRNHAPTQTANAAESPRSSQMLDQLLLGLTGSQLSVPARSTG
jgi:hypothetical protein